jgi:hypothetical protein
MMPEGVQTGILSVNNGIEKYHTWRIKVQHIKISWYLSWLIKSREPALQCKADLTIYNSEDKEIFNMKGRWANTPQISEISPMTQQERITYPDNVNINYYVPEILDCFVKYDKEKLAYGWNNESYKSGGKNSKYKLETGVYKIIVKLSGQNFPPIIAKFNIIIADDSESTSLAFA